MRLGLWQIWTTEQLEKTTLADMPPGMEKECDVVIAVGDGWVKFLKCSNPALINKVYPTMMSFEILQ